jgi:hypothetical protein
MPFSPGWPFLAFLLFLTTAWSHSFENGSITEEMFQAYQLVERGSMFSKPQPDNVHCVIVAVGDVHGNLDNLKKVLYMAGVTDMAGNWKKSEPFTDPREKWKNPPHFLVQVGDLMDR